MSRTTSRSFLTASPSKTRGDFVDCQLTPTRKTQKDLKNISERTHNENKEPSLWKRLRSAFPHQKPKFIRQSLLWTLTYNLAKLFFEQPRFLNNLKPGPQSWSATPEHSQLIKGKQRTTDVPRQIHFLLRGRLSESPRCGHVSFGALDQLHLPCQIGSCLQPSFRCALVGRLLNEQILSRMMKFRLCDCWMEFTRRSCVDQDMQSR